MKEILEEKIQEEVLEDDAYVYGQASLLIETIENNFEIDINNYKIAGVKAPTYHLLGQKEG